MPDGTRALHSQASAITVPPPAKLRGGSLPASGRPIQRSEGEFRPLSGAAPLTKRPLSGISGVRERSRLTSHRRVSQSGFSGSSNGTHNDRSRTSPSSGADSGGRRSMPTPTGPRPARHGVSTWRGRRRKPLPPSFGLDDDDEDGCSGPVSGCGIAAPAIDLDDFDMLVYTQRRTRRASGAGQGRTGWQPASKGSFRDSLGTLEMDGNTTSAGLMVGRPALNGNFVGCLLMDCPFTRHDKADRQMTERKPLIESVNAPRPDRTRRGLSFSGCPAMASPPHRLHAHAELADDGSPSPPNDRSQGNGVRSNHRSPSQDPVSRPPPRRGSTAVGHRILAHVRLNDPHPPDRESTTPSNQAKRSERGE